MRPGLQSFFRPRAVALVGATDRSAWSRTAYDNLTALGFPGRVHLVRRGGGSAHGQAAAASCAAIGEAVDTALLMLPAHVLEEALDDIAAAGIANAVLLSGGLAETGGEGAALQARIAARAADRGMRLLGPNCLGFINFAERAALWTGSLRRPALPGHVGVVSQSGAVANFLGHFAHQQGIGLSFIAATGNEAGLDLAGVLDYLVDDPATRSMALFAETVRDPVRFRAAAERAFRVGKPVVVLKVGRSEITAKSAQSHTGALVGDDQVFDGVCRQLGIARVDSLEALLVTAEVMGRTGCLTRDKVAVVSISGGICEIAADGAEAARVPLLALSGERTAALRAVLPDMATPHNPLDVTGAAMLDGTLMENAVRVLAEDPELGLIACLCDVPGAEQEATAIYTNSIASIGRGMKDLSVPVLTISHTPKVSTETTRRLAAEAGLSYVSGGLSLGLGAIGHAVAWSARQRSAAAVPEEAPAGTGAESFPASEHEALDHLRRHGVPVVPFALARDAEDAVRAAGDERVAMKIASPDIAHKSDIGGVLLDRQGAESVREGYATILGNVRRARPEAAIEGVLVAPMRRGGLELFVGVKRDPQWGAVLALGLGGVWIEALKDTSLRLLPARRDDVLDMLSELRAARLLGGYRGMPAADLGAVADAVLGIGRAALALGDALEAFEVNPLLVRGGQVEALDALATRRGGEH
ncbi:acetate--CoA ligase family protein [Roseomonas chloroacetimidivorans]|uniref:acetate--CoA ligase family protein n=1 Tax=Roseomonas chloroacetimidivorans TaxID=1766656 RepID=UPI003C727EC3